MLFNLKNRLRNNWLFPRYIGVVYIEPVLRELKSSVKGRMLDLGCGTRRYEKFFEESGNSYIGLDWPQIKDRAMPDVVGDAMKIPFVNSSFDAVLATELMEHLPSPQIFLAEVARVLRDGGSLILSVPFMEPLHEEPRDFFRFTPYSLHLLLEQHGFTVQKVWNKGGWWSVVLGSFVNQSLYDWATSPDTNGQRKYGPAAYLVLPFGAFAQWSAYQLDRLFKSKKYTLGYTLVAIRELESEDSQIPTAPLRVSN